MDILFLLLQGSLKYIGYYWGEEFVYNYYNKLFERLCVHDC